MIPEKFKYYNCYDDGKVTPNRQYKVLITDIIPKEEACEELLHYCDLALRDYSKLYDSNYNTIVIGISYEEPIPKIEIFLPTTYGKWMGIGEYKKDSDSMNTYWCSGVLDVDGKLTEQLEKSLI
jgi:hypothetical protein